MPRACNRKLVLAVPHISAAWRIARSAMPVTSAVRARRPLLDVFGDCLEADRVLLDEFVVEPVVLDHQVENAVEQRHIAAGLDRQEQIARSGHRRDAGIDDDDLRAVLAACQT